MTTTERLQKILDCPTLPLHNKDFVKSMLDQSKKRDLSDKQLVFVEKFWIQCFPSEETVREEAEWKNSLTEEDKENIKIMGEYYKAMYPGSNLARGISADPNYIPPKAVYEKSVAPDWAQRIVSNYRAVPKFKIGEIVKFRQTDKNRRNFGYGVIEAQIIVLDVVKKVENEFKIQYSVVDAENMQDQKLMLVAEVDVNVFKEAKEKSGKKPKKAQIK